MALLTGDPRLLRNSWLELFSGVEIDEREAEGGGALAQPAEHACAMVGVRGRRPGIVMDHAVFACAVDEQGEFASRRRNGFRFADAGRQASIERAEGRLGATQAHRGQAQDRRGPVGRGLRPGAEEATARDLVLRRQGEPRGEMFPSRPAAHVGADLGDETQRTVRANGMELREIDASERLEGAADVEAGFVAPGLRGRPRRRECACGRGGRGPEGLQVGLGRRVTGSQLVLNHVEQLQVLPQREEVLRPIVSGEGGGDLRFGGAAAMIPLLGEVVGIRAPGDDGSQNLEPRDAGDVTDDELKLQIQLPQRFLHPLDVRGRALDQRLPVAEIGPQNGDRRRGSKTAPQEPDAVQLPEPLAVRDIALAAGDVLHVPRIDEDDVEATALKDLVEGDPIHARGFHRHAGDPTGRQPVRETMQIVGKGLEGPHRRRITIGRDGNVMLGGPAIDAGDMPLDPLQE